MSAILRDVPSVVIVDDDEDQLFLTLKVLEKAKLKSQLVTIRGGSEIIKYLTTCYEYENVPVRNLPALILLDLDMPDVDGFTVLRWIRANPLLGAVKVVILSGSENPHDIERCKELGAHGFVTKRNSSALLLYILSQIFASPSEVAFASAVIEATSKT